MNPVPTFSRPRSLFTVLRNVPSRGDSGNASPKKRYRRGDLIGIAFAAPAMLMFVLFALYPMGRVVYLSFFNYNLLTKATFAGFQNYRYLWDDPVARGAVLHTLFYLVATYVPTIVIALLVALALNTKMRGSGLARLLWFLPVAMSWVAVSVIWNLVFQPTGLLDQLLHVQVNWLTSSAAAPWAMAIMSIWKEVGFFLILFLAGLQRIPAEFYEAASIDGAGLWKRFRHVTLPGLRPMTVVVSVLAVYHGLAAFTPQYVLTGGGPASSTEVVNLYVYNTAFVYGEMGRASALAVLLFIVLLAAAGAQWLFYRRTEQ